MSFGCKDKKYAAVEYKKLKRKSEEIARITKEKNSHK